MDLIDTWHLRSPTIIVQGDLPDLCMRHQWLLCLSDSLDVTELANHLALTHQHRRQDGIVLIGRTGHEHLLKELNKGSPSLLTTNYPVFMPTSYKDDIKLRLDSNIIFFNDSSAGNWKLLDIFSVKNGLPITLEVGKWDTGNGMMLQNSLNRWDRRTDLKGASFVNCVFRDWNPEFQTMLSYITDNLNLTIDIIESVDYSLKLLENGSWTGEIGYLQRKEVDVVSSNLGITLKRSHYIDYPIATERRTLTLHAAIRNGSAPNMWVYVNVYGLSQWLIYASMLLLMVTGLHLSNILSPDISGRKFGTKRGANKNYQLDSASSGLVLVCLYTIQMGSHTNSKLLASRLLTLTVSMFTFLFFAYYSTDITSEMTSGSPEIPIKSFQDVLHYDYQVITNTPYFEYLLSSAKPGTAKNIVYKNNHKVMKTTEAYEKVRSDSKTLLMAYETTVKDGTAPLKIEDSVYSISGLALQRDSEFLQLFNHYILRGYETGFFKRLFRNSNVDLFTRESYEMVEPQPLGFNNVMFCFMCLAAGTVLSIAQAILEFIMTKCSNQKKGATSTGIREEREKEGRRVRGRGGDEMGEEGSERENTN